MGKFRRSRIATAQLTAKAFGRAMLGAMGLREVDALTNCKNSFPWADRRLFGIAENAWRRFELNEIEPLQWFCHPRVLSEQPRLLRYYRNVAMLSKRELNRLAQLDVDRIEAGAVDRLGSKEALRLAGILNPVISALVSTSVGFETGQFIGLRFASVATTIQRASAREFGFQGILAVRIILLNYLKEEIAQVVWKDDTIGDYTDSLHTELIDRIAEVKVIRFNKGFHLVFGSEPDMSLRDLKDRPVIAIEVKAGKDRAGALERLGAGMKSFENDRALNPRVKTVYVVMSLTKAVQDRINQGRLVDHTFDLAQLLVDDGTQRRFANLLLGLMIGRN